MPSFDAPAACSRPSPPGDRNGCYARVGGPQAPFNLKGLYGKDENLDDGTTVAGEPWHGR